MTFFYPSIFSLILLSVIYTVIVLVLAGIHAYLVKRRKLAPRKALLRLAPFAIVFLLAPVAEELWIAWNFNRLCSKDAGIFIYQKVEVEGFYDDTHTWRADKLLASDYRWVEGRGEVGGKSEYWRHERVDGSVNSFRIDRPTARYHFTQDPYGVPLGHKLKRQESRVTDTEANKLIAEYREYIRRAPWFFIHLDRPNMMCNSTDGPRGSSIRTFLIYRDVLIPSTHGRGGQQ